MIAVVVAIILMVLLLPDKFSGPTTPIVDNIDIVDQSTVGIEAQESPTISESAEVGSDQEMEAESEDVNYYIDENGKKHYIISAEDSPIVGG